jgi:hypothetical protein
MAKWEIWQGVGFFLQLPCQRGRGWLTPVITHTHSKMLISFNKLIQINCEVQPCVRPSTITLQLYNWVARNIQSSNLEFHVIDFHVQCNFNMDWFCIGYKITLWYKTKCMFSLFILVMTNYKLWWLEVLPANFCQYYKYTGWVTINKSDNICNISLKIIF